MERNVGSCAGFSDAVSVRLSCALCLTEATMTEIEEESDQARETMPAAL